MYDDFEIGVMVAIVIILVGVVVGLVWFAGRESTGVTITVDVPSNEQVDDAVAKLKDVLDTVADRVKEHTGGSDTTVEEIMKGHAESFKPTVQVSEEPEANLPAIAPAGVTSTQIPTQLAGFAQSELTEFRESKTPSKSFGFAQSELTEFRE